MTEPLWVPIGAVAAVGDELAYAETAGDVTVTATTAATANTVVTAPAITVDDTTRIVVEFWAPWVDHAAAGNAINIDLFQDGAFVKALGVGYTTAGGVINVPFVGAREFVPTAGTHTYSIRAHMSTAGTGKVGGGTVGNYVPAFIRVSTVRPTGVGAGGAAVPACRAYHNTTQSIPAQTWTALAFNSERYDTGGIHDTVTNNSRLTCKEAGKYLLAVNIALDPNATGTIRAIRISLNAVTDIAIDARPPIGTAFGLMPYGTSSVYDLAVGDYVEAFIWHDATVALNSRNTVNWAPEFTMTKVG